METTFEFPEPLYETYICKKKVCLVCGSAKAKSVLRTTTTEIFPICSGCSFGWNFYGYEILKKVKPKQLIWNLVKFKLMHPFYGGLISIYKNLKTIEAWASKMKRYLKSKKEE
jgi:hypothetical protein